MTEFTLTDDIDPSEYDTAAFNAVLDVWRDMFNPANGDGVDALVTMTDVMATADFYNVPETQRADLIVDAMIAASEEHTEEMAEMLRDELPDDWQ